jgi:predicted nucleic acid-binding protein
MKGRFFLDTNVFVYELDLRAPAKAAQASELIRKALRTKRGVVSYQVVQEFFNVALKSFAKPLSVDDAASYLRTIFMPLLAVHSSPRLYLEAIRIKDSHHLSWYDSLIVSAALQANCETLYSEDLQDGRKLEGLIIENPF